MLLFTHLCFGHTAILGGFRGMLTHKYWQPTSKALCAK